MLSGCICALRTRSWHFGVEKEQPRTLGTGHLGVVDKSIHIRQQYLLTRRTINGKSIFLQILILIFIVLPKWKSFYKSPQKVKVSPQNGLSFKFCKTPTRMWKKWFIAFNVQNHYCLHSLHKTVIDTRHFMFFFFNSLHCFLFAGRHSCHFFSNFHRAMMRNKR